MEISLSNSKNGLTNREYIATLLIVTNNFDYEGDFSRILLPCRERP